MANVQKHCLCKFILLPKGTLFIGCFLFALLLRVLMLIICHNSSMANIKEEYIERILNVASLMMCNGYRINKLDLDFLRIFEREINASRVLPNCKKIIEANQDVVGFIENICKENTQNE